MRETESIASIRRALVRGELVRFVYRLGRQGASGVLTLTSRGSRSEVFVLRRGAAIVTGDDGAKKALVSRLVRLAAEDVRVVFEPNVAAYPPGAQHQVNLQAWARTHLEQQLDAGLAESIVHELAGVRIAIRPELAPEAVDEADRRMLTAMTVPRRLDQIWPLARTPRFRLLAFIHFLRSVEALDLLGVAAEPPRDRDSAPHAVPRLSSRQIALRTLGIDHDADTDTVKKAYRRLARTLHPDLQPHADLDRRRSLERKFAEVTAAYEALI